MSFAGHSLGQQGLTCSGRSHQKGTLGKFGTDRGIFTRIMQKIHHFLQRFLCFILTGYIRKQNTCLPLYIRLGFTLSDTAHHTAAFSHAAHDQIHTHDQKHKRNQKA